MKKILIVIALFVIAITWISVSNRYTNKLMSMCSDPVTETLYDCN